MREGGQIVVDFDEHFKTVQMKSLGNSMGPEKDGFTFDRVFPMGTRQVEVFDYGVKECVCAARIWDASTDHLFGYL